MQLPHRRPMTMRSMYVRPGTGGQLEYGERPMPVARGKNIVVQIHASSMNPHDWKYYEALLPLYRRSLPLPPLLLGHDLAGTVVEVGPKVRSYRLGDAVYAMSAKTGAFAQYISLDERMVAPRPARLSFLEAATLPMAALTAWQALRLAGLRPGQRLLVVGGSGGVGSLAIQIARAQGAEVTAVCSSANVELVRSLGADHVLDYTRQQLTDAGQRFDVVFDTVGQQPASSYAQVLQRGGQLVSTGSRLGNIVQSFSSRLVAALRPSATTVSTLLAMPLGSHLAAIGALVDSGAIRPLVDRSFELPDLASAMAYSKRGRTRGKIALQVSTTP